jgi:hypothetical protein
MYESAHYLSCYPRDSLNNEVLGISGSEMGTKNPGSAKVDVPGIGHRWEPAQDGLGVASETENSNSRAELNMASRFLVREYPFFFPSRHYPTGNGILSRIASVA